MSEMTALQGGTEAEPGEYMATSSDLHSVSYGDAPALLLFGDSPAGLSVSEAAARAAGGRIGASLPIAQSLARLDEQASVDAVVVDLVSDHGEMLDRLLDRLDAAAKAGRHASVVSIAPDLIDVVTARIDHQDVTLLCEPDEIERTAAIGMALAQRRYRLHDMGSDGGTVRLQQLSEEVSRIARTLAALSSGEQPRAEIRTVPLADRRQNYSAGPAPTGEVAMIRAMIRGRRLRDQFFDGALFADPAWDMMLDLMAARIEQRQVAVSSLCIAAAVPPTTGLRWIKTLTDSGLFVRIADPRDGRRVFIELSGAAAEGMAAYLAAIRRGEVLPV